MGQLLLIVRGTASFWSLWITQSFLAELAECLVVTVKLTDYYEFKDIVQLKNHDFQGNEFERAKMLKFRNMLKLVANQRDKRFNRSVIVVSDAAIEAT